MIISTRFNNNIIDPSAIRTDRLIIALSVLPQGDEVEPFRIVVILLITSNVKLITIVLKLVRQSIMFQLNIIL